LVCGTLHGLAAICLRMGMGDNLSHCKRRQALRRRVMRTCRAAYVFEMGTPFPVCEKIKKSLKYPI
jgi:hypothetical protein